MATKRTKSLTKEDFTDKAPANLLTNKRIKELVEEWTMYFENPSMRDVVHKNIQALTQSVLDGEVLVEKA